LVHTTPVAVRPVNDAFREIYPEADVRNVLDDRLLADLQAAGGEFNPGLRRRLAKLIEYSESSGADAILLTCSSYSQVALPIAALVDVPFFRADDALLDRAVDSGQAIGLIATVPTALDYASGELSARAEALGRSVTVVSRLREDAFQALGRGDFDDHDQMLIETIRELEPQVDVIALAQYSMARVMPGIPKDLKVPVLSSPHAGVERVKVALED
jgi:aspartate/glutamate racemase